MKIFSYFRHKTSIETQTIITTLETKNSTKSKIRIIQESFLRRGVHATKVLNHVMKGVIHREKIGPILKAAVDHNDVELQEHLLKFLAFDITPKAPFDRHPLCKLQIDKLKVMIAKETNAEQKEKLSAFLKKMTQPLATRLDMNESDWAILDNATFSVIQDHFENLCYLFNRGALEAIQEDLGASFGVDYKQALIGEVLAKSLGYTSHVNNLKINLPVKGEDGKYSLASYTIEELTVGDSLPCLCLESPNAKPWFVARGTNLQGKVELSSGFEALLADTIDHKGMAKDAVIKSMFHQPLVKESTGWVQKKSLIDRMEGWRQEGKTVQLAGHSLGGYIVTDIAIRFSPFVEKVYSYNAPGVSLDLAESWGKVLAADPSANEKIHQFTYEGDFATSAGTLIGHLVAVTRDDVLFYDDPIHNHLRLMLNGNFSAQKVNVHYENRKITRGISERVRAVFGHFIRTIVSLFVKQSMPDWWVKRDHYRRLLDDYEKHPELYHSRKSEQKK